MVRKKVVIIYKQGSEKGKVMTVEFAYKKTEDGLEKLRKELGALGLSLDSIKSLLIFDAE